MQGLGRGRPPYIKANQKNLPFPAPPAAQSSLTANTLLFRQTVLESLFIHHRDWWSSVVQIMVTSKVIGEVPFMAQIADWRADFAITYGISLIPQE